MLESNLETQFLIVTIDFETYYDSEYTLKKLSTSEYIRDKRFEAICCSFKVGNNAPYVIWEHDEIGRELRKIDPQELLAHHAHFEGLILSHHFGVRPRVYRDTLSMARAVFPKTDRNDLGTLAQRLGVANKLAMPEFKGKRYADLTETEKQAIEAYVNADVESCAQAYERLVAKLPAQELDLINLTVRLFAQPILRLDKPAAKLELKREIDAKREAIAASGLSAEELASNAPFMAAMAAAGEPVPMKPSPTDRRKLIPALSLTDTEFTSMEHHPNAKVASLVKARLAVKSTIGETRAKRLLYAAKGSWRLPVYLNYGGTHLLRWSGGDKLNFQNFPRSGELRRCITAPKGYVIVVVDSRQIQPRLVAWLAGEQWMLDAFANDQDIYAIFAEKIFGHKIDKTVDNEKRQVGKVCILALSFGMGAFRLQQTLSWGILAPPIHLSLEVCEDLVRLYREQALNVTKLWDTFNSAIGDMSLGRPGELKCLRWDRDAVFLPDGNTLHYPRVEASIVAVRKSRMASEKAAAPVIAERVQDATYWTQKGRTKLYGGLFTENMAQALERVIVAPQMLAIDAAYQVVMMSHDEIAFLARESEAEKALAFGLSVIRRRPAWAPDLPLDAEGKYAQTYSK